MVSRSAQDSLRPSRNGTPAIRSNAAVPYLLLDAEAEAVEAGVPPAGLQQLIVGAALDDPARLQHQNPRVGTCSSGLPRTLRPYIKRTVRYFVIHAKL